MESPPLPPSSLENGNKYCLVLKVTHPKKIDSGDCCWFSLNTQSWSEIRLCTTE